ncbi:AsmA-like C-terminal domain-containing protein [Helicobacter brantae]|uniref:YhdP central domain-containing protein n=1 Tax=Helicobacter brantae TaxID=375927 RepID=A0A3D8J3L4_9HELI|nr:AsmA-like C-terminal domain-containing protein [Helicobacter brantae]RDU72069.1 hypothetical protein CQA58_00245 [Helicobacter brantae]
MQTQTKKTKPKKKSIILTTLFLTLALLILGLFFTLYRGIHIQNLSFSNIKLQGLYLKLDNKFIFTLDKLQISPSNTQSSFNIQKTLRWFQRSLVAMSYFKEVEVRDIILPDSQHASIFYDGKRYELLFPSVIARFELTQDQSNIHLNIQKLVFEKYKINTIGKFIFSTTKNKLAFNVVANSFEEGMNAEEKLVIKGNSDLQTLNLSAFSTTLKSLDPFKEQIKELNFTLYKWLFQKSQFNNVRITNLFFSAPFNENFAQKLLKSLYAEITLENVALRLEENLPPITTPHLSVKYKNDTLSFLLDSPRYEDLKLDGSKVELTNFGGNLQTIVSIKSQEAILDQRLHHLLQTYDIDFDIHQKNSNINVDLKLTFEAQEEGVEVEAKGILKSQDADFDFFGFPIFAQNLNVVLDITPQEKHIFLNDSKLSFENPEFLGLVNCDINLKDKKAQGKINPDYLIINANDNPQSQLDEILEFSGQEVQQMRFGVDFADTPLITLEDFKAQISLSPTKNIILSDISKLYPYSPLLQYLAIHKGEIAIQTQDFKTIYIQTQISDLAYPLFDKKWNPIKELHSTIKITPKRIYASSLDESIILDYQDHFLKANFVSKNFDLDALEQNKIPFLSFNTPKTQQTQQTQSQESPSNFQLYLEAKDSGVRYKNWIVPTDEIIVNLIDGKIKADLTHKNGVANLDFYDDIIKFQANNFSGNFINLIADKTIVEGGLFSGKGIYKNKVLRGEIEIQNTIFKNFATLQNVVALIDTIPSLIVFKKPGLGADGYEVTQGRITFDVNNEYLGLKKIDLIGSSIDVLGSGVVKLEDKSIDIALNISTIKGLSEVLSKIPIVGYLLLGKEGKISTGVVIKGTLDDPKSEVTIAEDLISAPFKIIQRIFTGE